MSIFLIHLLIALLMVGLVCYAVRLIPESFAPAPIKQIVLAVIVVVFLIWLLLSLAPLLSGSHSLTL